MQARPDGQYAGGEDLSDFHVIEFVHRDMEIL